MIQLHFFFKLKLFSSPGGPGHASGLVSPHGIIPFYFPRTQSCSMFPSVPKTTIFGAGLCSTTRIPVLTTALACLPPRAAAWNRLPSSHLCLRSSPSLFTLNSGVLAHRAPNSCSILERAGVLTRVAAMMGGWLLLHCRARVTLRLK